MEFINHNGGTFVFLLFAAPIVAVGIGMAIYATLEFRNMVNNEIQKKG